MVKPSSSPPTAKSAGDQSGSGEARIYLSPPHVGTEERALLLEAFDSNWIAPLGPQVDAFEADFAAFVNMPYAVALSSGTAALHLALLTAGVSRDDAVLLPTLTFAATANAVTYVGAKPVFVDVDPDSWLIDVDLIAETLTSSSRKGRRFKALIAVDLYGQCPDYERLQTICDQHGVALIEDAAEAVGSTWRAQAAGSFGRCSAFSFNGNKIMTTGGGGMLLSKDRAIVDRARYLSTQARQPAPHYEHIDIGYNYRLSNLLAAVGRGQLRTLPPKIERRRAIRHRYETAFAHRPGVSFLREAPQCQSNAWLTCIQIDAESALVNSEDIRKGLEAANIEARPIWKPMHLQPIFRDVEAIGGDTAARLYGNGLCLPSGSNLTPTDQERVIHIIDQVFDGTDR